MEYLDTYDEDGNYLGAKSRDYVHENGLWHNTVHCWLYDKEGNVFFQIRHEENTLYTTASGHVLKGESIKEAFGREIKEELGITVDYEKAICIQIIPFKLDKVKADGTVFKDRVIANVYILEFNDNYSKFNFDLNEVNGLVKVNARETLDLFLNGEGFIKGKVITMDENKITSLEDKIAISDFLVNDGETLIDKYGFILKRIISITNI